MQHYAFLDSVDSDEMQHLPRFIWVFTVCKGLVKGFPEYNGLWVEVMK